MLLLGVDVGTTHCKAGLFEANGVVVRVATQPTRTHQSLRGDFYFEPQELWQSVVTAINDALQEIKVTQLAAIGIASMAESGVLVDRNTGEPRSPFIPWFDTSASAQADFIYAQDDPLTRFYKAGIHPNFKCSLAKLLWLREHGANFDDALWLGAAEYVAYRLTGCAATDYSLATRTGAFHIDQRVWDVDWIRHFGFDPAIFPVVQASTRVVGKYEGVPVFVAGHDHVSAALAIGATTPGVIFDSMGTAEALFGTLRSVALGEKEFRSGLVFGCHVVNDAYYWMGGLSSSGGSIEWLRPLLGDPPLSYKDVQASLQQARAEPTRILYYPYLSGTGTPPNGARVRGAFIGLDPSHARADMLKAALEGTAYEMESLRRAALPINGAAIDEMIVVGGGTRLRAWMQIKADVSCCRLHIADVSEAALLGAAMIAGIGSGVFANADDAVRAMSPRIGETIEPDAARHAIYHKLYEDGYMRWQAPLREYYRIKKT